MDVTGLTQLVVLVIDFVFKNVQKYSCSIYSAISIIKFISCIFTVYIQDQRTREILELEINY